MTQKIHKHFREEDVLKLNIHPETEKWTEELLFNNKEVLFYRGLLESPLIPGGTSSPEDSGFLFQQLQHIQKENNGLLQSLMDFRNNMEGMKECEDVQCENFYLRDYLTMKATMGKHFRNFRTVKNFIYSYLNNHNLLKNNK